VVYFQLINTGGVLYQILERKEVKIMKSFSACWNLCKSVVKLSTQVSAEATQSVDEKLTAKLVALEAKVQEKLNK
jgi:hypothetical protein